MGWVNLDESLGGSTTLKSRLWGCWATRTGIGGEEPIMNINNERVEIGSESKSYHKPLHFIDLYWRITRYHKPWDFGWFWEWDDPSFKIFQGDGDPFLSFFFMTKQGGVPKKTQVPSPWNRWSLDDEASDYSGVMQMLIFGKVYSLSSFWVHSSMAPARTTQTLLAVYSGGFGGPNQDTEQQPFDNGWHVEDWIWCHPVATMNHDCSSAQHWNVPFWCFLLIGLSVLLRSRHCAALFCMVSLQIE